MEQIGFEYDEKEYDEKKLTGPDKVDTHALIRRYLIEYNHLICEYQLDRIILVWMDKSYIDAGYCTRFSCTKDDEGKVVKNRVHGSEKGERLIIIHAMTHDEMLEPLRCLSRWRWSNCSCSEEGCE
jgi:hypothetical protein